MIKKVVRRILANAHLRTFGRAILTKHPHLRPYFFRFSRRFGLIQTTRIVRRTILQTVSPLDLTSRAARIYSELRKNNDARKN